MPRSVHIGITSTNALQNEYNINYGILRVGSCYTLIIYSQSLLVEFYTHVLILLQVLM